MRIETSITPTRKLFEGDNDWQVYSVVADKKDYSKIEYNKYGNFTVSGDNMPELKIGNSYDVVIEKDSKSKYPSSYKIVKFGEIKIATVEEQWLYLKAIVTDLQYIAISNQYREQSDSIIDIIRDGRFRFQDVTGFGETTYMLLRNKVDSNIELSTALAFFSQYGVTARSIASIVHEYGSAENAINKVKSNPYRLLKMTGFGFKKVDEIALNMGIEKDSPYRIESCFSHLIEEELNNGNTWINEKTMIDKSTSLLEIDRVNVEDVLFGELKDITSSDKRYTLKSVYQTELHIAKEIIRRNYSKSESDKSDIVDVAIKVFEDKNNLSITEEQRNFLNEFEDSNVSFLIGNAGSGKSLIQKMLIEYAKVTNKSVLLLAPTGRASKVLSRYTGRQAYTIHKRLTRKDKIREDIVIVDEASMCDIFIVKQLLESIENDNTKVVFIGDDAQIPSVGAGNFLYDCINSGVVKVNKLTKVFRQKEGGILDVATKARQGERFINSGYVGRRVFGKNCVLESTFSGLKEKISGTYKKLYNSQKWAPEDIVILTPTNKGELGTISINKEIQSLINPPSPMKSEHVFGEITLREGDLIMNSVNTYGIDMWENSSDYGMTEPKETDVFNGETGRIVNVNNDEGYVLVEIDDNTLKYDFKDAINTLRHAWCVTTYKAQGSQYKIVIALADKSSTYQLNANLLYTGFSRATEYMLILGQSKTLNIALGKFENLERKCFLQELLQKEYLQMNDGVL